MAIESKSTMIFDGDATGAADAFDQITQGGERMGRATVAAMRDAAGAIRQVTEQLMENKVATERLISERDALKKQLDELKTKNEAWTQAMSSAKSAISALGISLSVGGILKMIESFIEAQEKWNQEIVRTQVEYDKVARKLQVQALMKDEDFKEVRQNVLTPIARQYNMAGLEAPTELYQALFSQGITKEHMPEVMKQVIEGGRAIPGMGDEQLADFGIAMVRQLQDKGYTPDQIGGDQMARATVPATNVAGRLRLNKGSDYLAMQQQVGASAEQLGVDPNQMLAEIYAIAPHAGGREKAAQGLQRILLHLKSEAGQEAMGVAVSDAFNEKLGQGNVIGAFSTLNDALGQMSPQERELKLGKLFPARQGIVGRALLGRQGEAADFVRGLGDKSRIEAAQDIAGRGSARTEAREKLEEQLAALDQGGGLVEQNEHLIKFMDSAMKAQNYTAIRRKLVNWYLRMRAGGGQDLMKIFDGTHPEDRFGPGLGPAYEEAIRQYNDSRRPRERTGVSWRGEVAPAVPSLRHERIEHAWEATPQEQEVKRLQAEVTQLTAKLANTRENILTAHPGGQQMTDIEKRQLKMQEEQLQITKEHLSVSKDQLRSFKDRRAKTGMNN